MNHSSEAQTLCKKIKCGVSAISVIDQGRGSELQLPRSRPEGRKLLLSWH